MSIWNHCWLELNNDLNRKQVVFKQIQTGQRMRSLADALMMENRLAIHFMVRPILQIAFLSFDFIINFSIIKSIRTDIE